MKIFQKQLLALICMVAIGVCAAFAQTSTIKHIVDRGETLTSIAQRYSTTEAKIIELNPDAAQFVYVGMELIIPVVATTPDKNTIKADNSKVSESSSTSYTQEYNSTDNSIEENRLALCFEMGYGFIDKHTFAYEATLGVNYRAISDLYIGALIGYNSSYSSLDRTSINLHLLEIPVETGYVFATNSRSFAAIPFIGFDFNIGLSGKYKDESISKESTKIEIGGKLGVAFKVGIRFRIGEFNISGGYHIPLNDWQKGYFGSDAYPEISIGWGF